MVVIETNLGTIKLELDHQNTPNTAKNFLRYAEEGFSITHYFIVLSTDS